METNPDRYKHQKHCLKLQAGFELLFDSEEQLRKVKSGLQASEEEISAVEGLQEAVEAAVYRIKPTKDEITPRYRLRSRKTDKDSASSRAGS